MSYIKKLGALLLMAPLLVAAQSDRDRLLKQFSQSQQSSYREKVFLHTDRSFYLSGETIWFSVYNVDAYLHQPSDISKLLYVELLSDDQKPAYQFVVALNKGRGAGSVLLGNGLPSGRYVLRAYTAWMKNFSASNYFEQEIDIVNPFRPLSVDSAITDHYKNIVFFPESGKMVEGQAGRVAFKVIDRFGKGAEVRGILLNEKGDTLQSFQTSWKGMGWLNLRPEKGRKYYALLQFNDTSFRAELPPATETGFSMELNDSIPEKIAMRVRIGNAGSAGRVFLLAHTRGLAKFIEERTLASESVFEIPRSTLGEGISHLILFNSSHTLVAELMCWNERSTGHKLNWVLNKDVFGKRDRVEIDLDELPESASVSIFQSDAFQTVATENVIEYLLTESDLKGPIEFPERNAQTSDGQYRERMGLILATNGWSSYGGGNNASAPVLQFLPDREGQLIQGQISDRASGSPVSGVEAFISAPGSYFSLASAVSDDKGRLLFNLEPFVGTKELVVHAIPKANQHYRVDVVQPFSDKFNDRIVRKLTLNGSQQSLLEQKSLNSQVENAFFMQHKIDLPAVSERQFYGKADKTYQLDDYTRFPTMEEVMHEYIPEVRVRKSGQAYGFTVKNSMFNDYFQNDPLILIDGVPVTNAGTIMALDPLKIKEINILTQKVFLGPVVKEGMVSYQTYNGDLAGYTLDPDDIVVNYQGLQQRKKFYAPSYDGKSFSSARIPDKRQLLHWDPLLEKKRGADGKLRVAFYTSDLPGKYVIVVQGIGKTGIPYYSSRTFDVE